MCVEMVVIPFFFFLYKFLYTIWHIYPQNDNMEKVFGKKVFGKTLVLSVLTCRQTVPYLQQLLLNFYTKVPFTMYY